MKCPVCVDTDLAMMDRQGVEIDYCPKCRGVWLDRGELDKLMDRAAASMPQAAAPQRPGPTAPAPYPQQPASPYGHRDFQDSDAHKYGGYPKRKKSWLNEIFD
ncbi:zf-TFIIB domain-containing protein [Variovorax sp. PCZ-1]|uniref:TFIIB-type zinc ribbon-containing protein n=1 Tax=Variovorax sp. PCZ-1 TaxID=2835533 RepID=UPI001BCCBB2C|nr:zf-TFIIB domain-containing protein [Variovorax sp. PCZ-1]MBS7806397.1 zf-TFIIB domain-containing protein [Variovorax sp. PCZ-1]